MGGAWLLPDVSCNSAMRPRGLHRLLHALMREAIAAPRHPAGEDQHMRVVEAGPGRCFRTASAPGAVVAPDAMRGFDREGGAPLRGCIVRPPVAADFRPTPA
jgi:hypothetical protein